MGGAEAFTSGSPKGNAHKTGSGLCTAVEPRGHYPPDVAASLPPASSSCLFKTLTAKAIVKLPIDRMAQFL